MLLGFAFRAVKVPGLGGVYGVWVTVSLNPKPFFWRLSVGEVWRTWA